MHRNQLLHSLSYSNSEKLLAHTGSNNISETLLNGMNGRITCPPSMIILNDFFLEDCQRGISNIICL